MNILTVIPIYRNKFQEISLFFSKENFSIGSIILVPYSKLINPKNKQEKPVLIIDITNVKSKKQFLRKTNIPVNKSLNSYEFKLFSSDIIKDIGLKTSKIKKPLEFSLDKLFTKNIKKELNSITEKSDKTIIKNYIKKINPDFISQKLKPFLKQKKVVKIKTRGIHNIKSLLPIEKINKNRLHSEKHYLVDEIRKYFNETAKKGKGSFSFYLGFFKRVPEAVIYQYWAEVKESRQSTKNQLKLFWWKIGKFLKNKN